MSKRFLLLFVITIALITGCSSNGADGETSEEQGSDEEKEIVLKLGHVWPNSEIHAQATEKFAEEVEELSNGQLIIEIYEDGTLGSDKDVLEGLNVGTADIWVGGAGVLSGSSDTAKIFTVPFLFDDQAHFDRVYNGEIGEEISSSILEESGYKVLSYWERGARWLTINNEVNTPEDLAGKKIRVPESPVFVKAFEHLGAAPTPMSFDEVFTSIQQGVIDGQENPLSLIYNSKFNEVVDYLVKTEHVREPISLVISENTFNNLNQELQDVLMQAANGEAKTYAADTVISSDTEYLQKLQDEGMTLVDPDISAFQEKLEGFVENEFPEIIEIYETIRAASN